MKRVIDASVAVKWLAPEPDSPLADVFLDDELIVPDLLFAEVGNFLWKKHLRGEMTDEATRLGARFLLQVPLQVHDSTGLLVDALALALRLQHPAYDCFYLALAQRVDTTMVTADRRLHARCRSVDPKGWGERVKLLEAE